MKKVIFFTNIIAPYRVSLFNELEELRSSTNFDFEVYFMRKIESNRAWPVRLEDIKFKYQLGNGFYAHYKKVYFFHFNPILIYKLIKSQQEIILGDSWNGLNILFIAWLKSMGLIKNKLSVWSEANYLTNQSRTPNKLRDRLKKWFFSKIDGHFILPGQMGVVSFIKWDIPVKNIIFLPNLISSQLFQSAPYIDDLNKRPVFFMAARLEEEIKGVKNFLQAIGNDSLKKIELRIAGSGSSLSDYQNYIKENNLEDNVFFLGDLLQEDIATEYTKANVFVLASFSDPSPLSIIEAISSGLPVLISENCGNHYETVINGENGYTFNPNNTNEIKEKFEKLISQRGLWASFSKKSIELAKANFDNEKRLKTFIDSYSS